MRVHKIAAIGGDGIGPEVIAAGLEALAVCARRDGGFALEVEHFDWIVFEPLKDGFGAYNRYFGRLSDGSVKVRSSGLSLTM